MPESVEHLCQAWLSCSESLGMKPRARLMELYGSAEAFFKAFSASAAEIVGPKACQELAGLKDKGLDKLELALRRSGIRLAIPGDACYPELLTQIPDPPPLLFFRGTLLREEPRAIAIVGSRRETRYGREQAHAIAQELAKNGVAVISGLARGIDTAAHQGALDAGGRTLAILGSGIKQVYPGENAGLAEKLIEKGGALISEFAPNAEPLAYRFPQRNRLVSGLSHGVLLVEAREKSGTLITVGHALTQGREVFAMPGPVDAPGSAVPHRLLREGARLATCAQDILEDMGWSEAQAGIPADIPPPDLTNEQRRLYDALCVEPLDFNGLLERLDLPAQQLNVLLTTLEMEGLIESLPGRMFRLSRMK